MIRLVIIIIAAAVIFGGIFFYMNSRQFKLPKGETEIFQDGNGENENIPGRQILITGGVKHSIPLNEILSGGPPKDGIPSIDNPRFLSIDEADFVGDEEAGTGLCVGEDCRFYPYQIMVWHEIANDIVGNQPVLVTYCPLCRTGIVFGRVLNGVTTEFGTTGKLWRSNLLMYNRSDNPENESMWSQVLGEAVVGEHTGTKLNIVPSDVIRFGDWKKLHPDTKVLSKDTGFIRTYGYDPYGSYYSSDDVSFGATFDDTRLHPKEFVLGIEVDGKFKAYHSEALKAGKTSDSFNGQTILIDKKPEGEVRMFRGDRNTPQPYIGGFWFSWLAVHPDTELFK